MSDLLHRGPQGAAAATTQATRRPAHPFITVVIPTLNEERYVADCLASLIGQWPEGDYEILVVDGGSTDATPEIVRRLAESQPMLRWLANPKRIQSAAMNLAARHASPRATVLVRADAHAVYPPNFIHRCVTDLLRSGATSVVVPMRNEAWPGQGLQRAIAAAQSSLLGNGGAAHRVGAASGFIEHGHHAAFDRAFFLSIGGYDESFTHNEDAELDHRAIRAGGRIWMCGEAPVLYYPRATLRALAAQYLCHGRGRARTLRKHGLRPRPRQMAPVAALLGCSTGLAATPLAPALLAAPLAYAALCCGWGALRAARQRDPWLVVSGPALMVMHMAWAAGFLQGAASRQAPGPNG